MFDDNDETTVDLSTATMKSVGVNGSYNCGRQATHNKHAGIFSALGLLDDNDSTTNDSDINNEIEELMEPSGGAPSKYLSVTTVYSDMEEETEKTEPSGSAARNYFSVYSVTEKETGPSDSSTEEETERIKQSDSSIANENLPVTIYSDTEEEAIII